VEKIDLSRLQSDLGNRWRNTQTVRPHLEYANTVCHPQFKKDVQQIERVQRRSTKLITGLQNTPYEKRLKIINLLSLIYRRYTTRWDIIEVYKYLHGMYFVPSDSLLSKASPSALRGHDYKLLKKHCHSHAAETSVLHLLCITSLWNCLPVKWCPPCHWMRSRLLGQLPLFSINPDTFLQRRLVNSQKVILV